MVSIQSERETGAPLTPEGVQKILSICSPRGLLVVGLNTKDLARRAIELEIPVIGRLRVIHPIDVLDSRVQNLHLFSEKRTDAGVAQARLAVNVARAFIAQEVATRGERVGRKRLERVPTIAADIAAVRVFLLFEIDPLQAVPLEDLRTTSSHHRVRRPRIIAEVMSKRESLKKLSSRPTRSRK